MKHNELAVTLTGPKHTLSMKNPVMTASWTFGYGMEFARFGDLAAQPLGLPAVELLVLGLVRDDASAQLDQYHRRGHGIEIYYLSRPDKASGTDYIQPLGHEME